jgi:hypothetical protein
MAAITQTNATTDSNVPVTLSRLALSASDTLTYIPGARQMLVLYNTTASLVTATIVGSGATTISPAGYGGTISVAAGKAIAVPANGTVLVDLDDISAYLIGSITITGGTGLTAHLFV